MNYWSATDDYLRDHGAPRCPECGKEMFPEDDHGRFTCFCSMRKAPGIPQVDTTGMTDAEKAHIPTMNRLNSTCTAAEAKYFALLAKGPAVMDTEEYWEAQKAVEAERTKK